VGETPIGKIAESVEKGLSGKKGAQVVRGLESEEKKVPKTDLRKPRTKRLQRGGRRRQAEAGDRLQKLMRTEQGLIGKSLWAIALTLRSQRGGPRRSRKNIQEGKRDGQDTDR